MKIQFKRIVSAVCALAMCASMIPASAMAETVKPDSNTAIVQQLEEAPAAASGEEQAEPVAPNEEQDVDKTEEAVAGQDTSTAGETEEPVIEDVETSESEGDVVLPTDDTAEVTEPENQPEDTVDATEPENQTEDTVEATEPETPTEDSAEVSEAPGMAVMADAPQSRAATVTVVEGKQITYNGLGSSYLIHDWEIESGSANVSIQSNGNKVVITGKQAGGTARLKHTYSIVGYVEYVDVTVVKDVSGDRSMFLFVAKPTNSTLSDKGDDYYYLASGGRVSDSANHSTSVKNTTDESVITQYVDEWPTELDFLTGTSSESVGAGSTIEIDDKTGEVRSFRLYLDKLYTSDDYGIRWAKFSYADTASYGSHYHVDAILYEKKDVNDILNDLGVKKLLEEFSLDEQGSEKTSETFNFQIVDLADDDTVLGTVNINLTATVTETGKLVSLDAGEDGSKILPPGRYKLYEVHEGTDSMVWEDTQEIVFEVYTNGDLNPVRGGTMGDCTITNIPKTYSLKYYLEGGTVESPIADVTGQRYNARVPVTETVPTMEGNVFLGWSTTAGGDVEYKAGDKVIIQGETELHAIWGPVSVQKSVVLSNTDVDNVVDKDDYATVITSNNENVTYTTDGKAEILYKVQVNAYKDAEVTIDEKPQGGTVSYVAAVGATPKDASPSANPKSFKMTDSQATLYYKVSVTDATSEGVTVTNSVDWKIATQQGTTTPVTVKVIKTDKTVEIEKKIVKIVRDEKELTGPFSDETVLRVGDAVTWQITVTNVSKDDLGSVIITDTTSADGTPTNVKLVNGKGQSSVLTTTWTDGTAGSKKTDWNIGALEYDLAQGQGESATITYDYTVVASDKSQQGQKDLTNTAAGENVSLASTSKNRTQNFVEVPAIEVVKEGNANFNAETGKMEIAYTITVTNKSNATLSAIALTDAKFPSAVTVENDGVKVDDSKIQHQDDTITVTDTLGLNKTLTLEYVYEVVESEDANGALTVKNTVDVVATTSNDGSATGFDECETTVYGGKVELELAPIVIYTGGDGSSQAIVGSDGKPTVSSENGLPTFGVTMTLPNDQPVKVDGDEAVVATLYDVKSTNSSWSAVGYNDNATVLMQLRAEGDSRTVRVQLKDGETIVTDDQFEVENSLFETYETSLYVAQDENAKIIAKVGGQYYTVDYQPSTLTVRGATEHAQDVKVVNSESSVAADAETPQAVLPASTQYYYVSSDSSSTGTLQVADTSGVSLLVDEIVDQNVPEDQQYVQQMKDKAENDSTILGKAGANTTRKWRFYYMDLVLKTNGNAVLTADQDVTIYWQYPEGVTYQDAISGKYQFQMLHYVDLDRNYASGNFESELAACKVEKYTVTPTEKGLRFTVPKKDGFSPYALVYDYTASGGSEGGSGSSNNSNNTVSQPKAEESTTNQPAVAPTSAVTIPQTGDEMPIGLLMGVAGLAVVALVALAVLRRRKDK